MAKQKIEFEISANNRKAIHAMDKFRSKASGIASGVAGQLGMALGVAGIISYGKELMAIGDKVAKLGRRFGMTAEQVQMFQYMAERSGSSLDAVSKAQKTLTSNINDANMGMTSYIRYFKQLGVDYKELQKMSPEKQFETVAKAIAGLDSQQRKVALSSRIMGRSGSELIPMFQDYNNLADQAKSKVVFNDQQAKAAEKYADAMTDIGKSFDQIMVNSGAIEYVANWMDALARTIDLKDEIAKAKAGGATGALVDEKAQYAQVGAKAMTAFNPAALIGDALSKAFTGNSISENVTQAFNPSGEMISTPAAELTNKHIEIIARHTAQLEGNKKD